MKTKQVLTGILALGLLPLLALGLSQAQELGPQAELGSAFSYQGRLTDAGGLVNGPCDFEFSLWDAAGSGEPPSGGTQIGATEIRTGVVVAEGLFTIANLDFGGAAFTGQARWLQIAVRCPAGGGTYATLAPRQALTAAPQALYAATAPWSGLSGVPPGFADGIDDDTDTLAGLTCPDGHLVKWDDLSSEWVCAPDEDALGGLTCTEGQLPKWNPGTGQWECGDDTDTDTLAGLSCPDGQVVKWDDLSSEWVCAPDEDALGGLTCTEGQLPKWNPGSSQWECSNDTDTDTLAGLSCPDGQLVKWDDLSSEWVCAPDEDALGGLTCTEGQLPKWNPGSSQWECGNDVDTDTDTLAGLSCPHGQLVKWDELSSEWVCAQDEDVLGSLSCTEGQLPKWNPGSSQWECGNDDNSTYTPGTGLDLSAGAFSLFPSYQLPQACGNGEIARWTGAAWICAPDADTTYTPGTGLDLSGDAFSLLPTYQLPQACAGSEIARWNGTDWVCTEDADTTYTAATGLALDGTSLSVDPPYRLPQTCVDGQVTKWEDAISRWVCGDDEAGGAANAWLLTGNAGTNPATHFLGTTDNQVLELRVNGARVLRLVPDATIPNLVGGHSANEVIEGAYGATIGGGGPSDPASPDTTNNRVTDNYGTIGGGGDNQAGDGDGDPTSAIYATVGGGFSNTASEWYATIGGGYGNTAGWYATVCGGEDNTASNALSTVGGGLTNTASGWYSSIGGGYGNTASDNSAAVAGGAFNIASGVAATVSGGQSNAAQGSRASVGGGWENLADGSNATVSGGYSNTASGTAATVPGGASNSAAGDYSFAAGRRAQANHDGSFVWADAIDANFASTANNQFLARATGGFKFWVDTSATGLRLFPVSDAFYGDTVNVLAGHGGNHATEGIVGATISGGGGESRNNIVSGHFGTIGGGGDNTASGTFATVAGGYGNHAANWEATVGGGLWNVASGERATVGGGDTNQALGDTATVPGGIGNIAEGAHSFAAGKRAKTAAAATGSFVWGDNNDLDIWSWGPNEFVARSTGGFWFITAISAGGAPTEGMHLASGSSTWSPIGSSASQANLSPVDGREVLRQLADVPIQTWNSPSQDPAVRHIGPAAEDFYGAFGVGDNERAISTVDADGVALAAIQGLYELVEEKDTEMVALQDEVATLREQNADLEARLAALESRASAPASPPSRVPSAWLLLGGLVLASGVVVQRRLPGGGR